MDESSTSKRQEAREFWEEAIRLWTESGLSVREFCTREGLADKKPSLYPEGIMPPNHLFQRGTPPI